MTLQFGPFTLNADTRQLERGGNVLHLSTKAFDLLRLLIEKRPAVVEKKTLRESLWPGTHVVDANLTNLIVEIRSVLSDRPDSPVFIRTVHGVGYAFCGEAADGTAERAPQARFWVVWQGRAFVLAEEETVIGRDPACGIWVDAAGVSRRHARIRLPADADGHAVVDDLESTNGTFIGARRVRQGRPLSDGDQIQIGRATITFRTWAERGGPTKRVRRR